ncbi:hypothetical protein Tco_0117230 [Tanacetum coccineum]
MLRDLEGAKKDMVIKLKSMNGICNILPRQIWSEIPKNLIQRSSGPVLGYDSSGLKRRSTKASCKGYDFYNHEEELDLFAFINHADPTKVRIGKPEVGEVEVLLLQLTRDRVVPLAGVNDQGNANVQGTGNDNVNEEGGDATVVDQTEQSDHVVQIGRIDITVDDEAQAIFADKPKKVRKKRKAADGASGSGLPPKKLREDHEVGITVAATVPFVTSSVTPTPEREEGGRTNSVTGPNLRTQHAAERFVVLSNSSHHFSTNVADDEVTSIVRSSMPPPPILTATVSTTIILGDTSALAPRAGIRLVLHTIFRDSTSTGEAHQDVASPSHPAETKLFTDSFFVSRDLRSMDYEQLFVGFNVGAARQTCLNSEVRLRLEHELRGRKKFKDKCVMHAGWLKERDAEIANLKAQLSLKEAEVAEAIRLRGQVTALESAAATKDSDLESYNTHIAKVTQDLSNLQLSCDELSIKASSLEFEKDKLVDQVSKLEGTCSELRDEVSGYKLFKERIEAVP